MSEAQPTVVIYTGQNRGRRTGFRVQTENTAVHDSGLIYNDDLQAKAAINRFMGRKDKDGNALRGPRFNLNRNGVFSRRAHRTAAALNAAREVS